MQRSAMQGAWLQTPGLSMISLKKFQDISSKYGSVASWAVWKKADTKPKSNIGDMDILDPERNPDLLKLLKVNVVMVGLNFSRDVQFDKPFMNFHDSSRGANDFKIRFAFEDTCYYGGYMTDIIKNSPKPSSEDVREYLKENPEELREQINSFREELSFIGSKEPTIIAFGRDVYDILRANLKENEYKKLIKITHYSHYIGKEKYRKETHERLGNPQTYQRFCADAKEDIERITSAICHYKNLSNDDLLLSLNLKATIQDLLSKIEELERRSNGASAPWR